MTDYSEVKTAAEIALQSQEGSPMGRSLKVATFYSHATPAAVLALIAENERLKAVNFDYQVGADAASAEIARLKAENAALRKDRDMVIKVLGLSLDEFSKLAGKISGPQPNTGHGHVFPREDGVRARCGGPGICKECSLDKARKENGQCS